MSQPCTLLSDCLPHPIAVFELARALAIASDFGLERLGVAELAYFQDRDVVLSLELNLYVE